MNGTPALLRKCVYCDHRYPRMPLNKFLESHLQEHMSVHHPEIWLKWAYKKRPRRWGKLYRFYNADEVRALWAARKPSV